MAVKALLLCAGLGTRLRPYTEVRPKPCIPFWGVPLAYYSLFLLKQTATRDIAVNLHHLPDQIKYLLSQLPDKEFQFSYSLEKDKPMGSGGALYYAKHLLQDCESFFAINSDEVFVPSSQDILVKLQQHHQNTKSLLTLLVTDHPELCKTLKPIWINKAGDVLAFGDKPSHPEVRPVHYTGCKIFSKEVLSLLPEGESHIFHDTIVPAIKNGARVNTLFDNCQWWETGNFKSFLEATAEVTQLIQQDLNNNHFKKVYDWLGKNFDFKINTQGQISAIHRSAQMNSASTSGTLFIDRDSQIKSQIHLEDVIINKKSHVINSSQSQMHFEED